MADAAAREAYEEAGVHGRIEASSFTHYLHRKRTPLGSTREHLVHAHLCEVDDLVPPPETYRMPTWFSPDEAKRRLARNRTSPYAAETARVVDLAVMRVRDNFYFETTS